MNDNSSMYKHGLFQERRRTAKKGSRNSRRIQVNLCSASHVRYGELRSAMSTPTHVFLATDMPSLRNVFRNTMAAVFPGNSVL